MDTELYTVHTKLIISFKRDAYKLFQLLKNIININTNTKYQFLCKKYIDFV